MYWKGNFIAGYCTQITGLCAKFELCTEKLHLIIKFHSVLQIDTPGWHWLTWTHLDCLYSHGSLIWRTHLQALDPPGMDTPGSTWNGHTWTHLDDIYPHGWFRIIRYTWKVWTHLETLNIGAMEPLMDSSRQLLWILPDNSYGFFQTTLMDSSRQLLWILLDNSYGFFQTTLMDSSRSLGSPWPMNQLLRMVSGKLSSWQEHWLKDQCRYPILSHWRMWSAGTPGMLWSHML